MKVLHECEWYFYHTDSMSLNEQVIQSRVWCRETEARKLPFLTVGTIVSASDPKYTCDPIFGARNPPSKSLLPKQTGQAHKTHIRGCPPSLYLQNKEIKHSRFIGKVPDAGKDWGQEEKGVTEDEMVGCHHPLNGHESEQTLGDSEWQGSLVCGSPCDCKELDTSSWLSNNNKHSQHIPARQHVPNDGASSEYHQPIKNGGGCLLTQSCMILCDPTDYSPPGSSVHGILQARILEWVAISFSRGYFWPKDRTCISWIGRQILYHWTTWEAPIKNSATFIIERQKDSHDTLLRKITCRKIMHLIYIDR